MWKETQKENKYTFSSLTVKVAILSSRSQNISEVIHPFCEAPSVTSITGIYLPYKNYLSAIEASFMLLRLRV